MADNTFLDVYSPEEETANTITHGLGIIFGLVATYLLISETIIFSIKFWAFLIYGLSIIILYSASTVYHFVKEKKRKLLFKKIDHIAIYILIAGTFTPFAWDVLGSERLGQRVLLAVWLVALAGIIFKLFYTGKYEVISLLSYLGMGWMGYIMFDRITELLSAQAVDLMLYGGAFYSGGVLFYLWKKLKYHHAIWHLCVLGGTFCHFLAIYQFVVPFS